MTESAPLRVYDLPVELWTHEEACDDGVVIDEYGYDVATMVEELSENGRLVQALEMSRMYRAMIDAGYNFNRIVGEDE